MASASKSTEDESKPIRVKKSKHNDLSPTEITDEPKKKKKKYAKAPMTTPNLSLSHCGDGLFGPHTTSTNSSKKFSFDTPHTHHTLNNLNSAFFSGKRPRGRPPLSGKKPSITPYISGSQMGSTFEIEAVAVAPVTKAPPRPPYKIVTKKLFSKLLACDPITVDDICKRLPECPKNMLCTTLGALQILGLGVQREITENFKGRYAIGTLVYCPANYLKFPHMILLDKLEEEIAKKAEECQRIRLRLDSIYVGLVAKLIEDNIDIILL